MPPVNSLAITIGASSYTFPIIGAVPVRLKPLGGELRRTTARVKREDQLDAPWSIDSITGIGASRAVGLLKDHDRRAFEMKSIDAWPGMWCLGPNARTVTDLSGTRQVLGFAEGIGNLFYFSENTGTLVENIAYFVGSTATWTNATATADFNAGNGTAPDGFPCRAVWEHNDGGTAKVYALRRTVAQSGTPDANYQLMSSTDGTTWTLLNHGIAPNTANPSGQDAGGGGSEGTTQVYNGLDIDGTSYTLTYSGTTVQLRQATGTLTTWSNSTGGVSTSSAAPIWMAKWRNAAGTVQPFIFTREGILRYTGSAMVQEVLWQLQDTNNGKFATVWQPSDLNTDFLVVPNGPNLWAMWWDSNARLQARNISPIYRTQGMPTFRQGRILALAVSSQFLWAWIGGEDASHTGGWYKNDRPDPDTWIGPVYVAPAANRQVRAGSVSLRDDNTVRLHQAIDNGTASDTDQMEFRDIDSDPRTVTSYQHAAVVGSLVLPKNDRGLPEQNGIWRKIEAIGTNLSATNKITDVFNVADAAPIGSDGAWGTTLGEITATAGTLNFVGTPSGTGAGARAEQIRVDLEGAANASPYIEALNVYVKKLVTDKYLYTFTIDLQAAGTVNSPSKVLSDLQAVLTATSDLSVTWGGRAATVMEVYKEGGNPITYVDEAGKAGTVNANARPVQAQLMLVEV